MCAGARGSTPPAPVEPLKAIDRFDVGRHLGAWYEIAKYPNRFQRQRWNRDTEAEGRRLLATALLRKRAGPFQIRAAISACQMADPAPDWPQILHLYTVLATHESDRRFLAARAERLG